MGAFGDLFFLTNMHRIVKINKQFNYFSMVYFKKNLDKRWEPSLDVNIQKGFIQNL
jgi:hypothetical protein